MEHNITNKTEEIKIIYYTVYCTSCNKEICQAFFNTSPRQDIDFCNKHVEESQHDPNTLFNLVNHYRTMSCSNCNYITNPYIENDEEAYITNQEKQMKEHFAIAGHQSNDWTLTLTQWDK
jgi:hypothetical protein